MAVEKTTTVPDHTAKGPIKAGPTKELSKEKNKTTHAADADTNKPGAKKLVGQNPVVKVVSPPANKRAVTDTAKPNAVADTKQPAQAAVAAKKPVSPQKVKGGIVDKNSPSTKPAGMNTDKEGKGDPATPLGPVKGPTEKNANAKEKFPEGGGEVKARIAVKGPNEPKQTPVKVPTKPPPSPPALNKSDSTSVKAPADKLADTPPGKSPSDPKADTNKNGGDRRKLSTSTFLKKAGESPAAKPTPPHTKIKVKDPLGVSRMRAPAKAKPENHIQKSPLEGESSPGDMAPGFADTPAKPDIQAFQSMPAQQASPLGGGGMPGPFQPNGPSDGSEGRAGGYRESKKLCTDWLHASLPLSETKADRGVGGSENFLRLCGSSLDRDIGTYYVDLGMRDFRLFLAHILKELGIPYHAASYRQVPATRLANLLRQMGVPARSELMNAICDNLVWCEDQFVSFSKLVEMLGDLEIENFGKASDPSAAIERIKQRVELKRKVEEESYERERLKILTEQEARNNRMKQLDPRSMLTALRKPESFTPTTISVVTTLYEMMQQSKITPEELISGVMEVTGAPHADRLTKVLDGEYGGRKLSEIRLQDILVAALSDARDHPVPGSKPVAVQFSSRRKNTPYVSPITHRKMGEGAGTAATSLLDEDLMMQAGGMPDDEALQWFHSVLCNGLKFPPIPLEKEIKNLKQLAASISSGWIQTAHFKQLCDVWDLPLNQHLGQAVRDHQARGRCSLRTLWKGLVLALEQQGCRL